MQELQLAVARHQVNEALAKVLPQRFSKLDVVFAPPAAALQQVMQE
jgi:hypothetical protein